MYLFVVQYLAEEVFPSLPDEVRLLSYAAFQDDPELVDKYAGKMDRVRDSRAWLT